MINQHDLLLLQGEFFDGKLPPEYRFLLKYFSSEIERQFLFYWFAFSGMICRTNGRGLKSFYRNFVDHTGFYCSNRWFLYLVKKVRKITSAFEKARVSMDLQRINFIKDGRCKGRNAI